jgi:hypothetical protein
MRRHRFSIAAIALVLAACTGGGDEATPSTPPPSRSPVITPTTAPSVRPSPTEPALPDTPPATAGPIAADCVNGWTTPPEGSARYAKPLAVIRREAGVEGPLEVVDMRYFVGPESPPSDKGYLLEVERWYVRTFARDDPSFQGRFLVERRRFGTGLVAVAPYDTTGYRSPDWVGFQFDSADQEPRYYEGLPGLWSGTPYDFVNGGEGLEIPGLPSEVTGCLDAT